MKRFVKILKKWFPLGVAVTLLCGIVYVTIQQTYRMEANDPQVQIAEDIRATLEQGTKPEQIVGQTKVDIGTSLDTFVDIYGADKNIVASSATLNGTVTSIPTGVLDAATKKGETRVTWQPQKGVRIAAVVTKYKDGYVLVGRNLREVESRVSKHGFNILIGWAVTMAATFAAVAAVELIKWGE